ncbi:hypothetical protein PILCRDRAFT_815901 [Piloderma croceum F 1598]|uniref:F-box domain-containing protein n=1 Tax=Piloderma croceum (strain F 1598) TaxID=765440 RepID=A0A0C3FRV1_PILCF|nr:hypothetical protein PILCRDRAFT_815901 [Piloderma croceum F 1598]
MAEHLPLKIPSELADTIIDCLHDDSRALASCSVVCRAWLPRSRFHLFEHILLEPSRLQLFDLLDSPLSTIAPYVRCLHLEEGRGRYSYEPEWLNKALPRLAVFTAVESLEVDLARFDLLETETTRGLVSNFRMLRNLHFWHVKFRTFSQLVDVLGECPHLEHISFDCLFYQDKWDTPHEGHPEIKNSLPTSCAQRIPLHLRTFDLGSCEKNAILYWLLSGNSCLVINTLRLRTVCLEETRAIGAFVRTLGPSLEHLEINFAVSFEGDVEKAFCRNVDLAGLIQLRSLHLSGLVMYSQYRSSTYVGWVSILLSQITSMHIEEVVFDVWLSVPEDLDPLDWDVMGKVFAQPSFSRLKRIHFWVWGDVNREQARVSIRERLPVCDARGLLEAKWPQGVL